MALIRIVTASADVMAAARAVSGDGARVGDRRAASLAAVLFQLVPLPFDTLGNANLPNMFGQSMALATIAAAVTWRLDLRRRPRWPVSRSSRPGRCARTSARSRCCPRCSACWC
jgi:hypothetical protein